VTSARVYLDHNASSPLRAEARAVIEAALGGPALGNPSSAHAEGRRARSLLEEAREQLAVLLSCPRDGLVFTSGGTESNALALTAAGPGQGLVVAAAEHPSVLQPAAAREGTTVLPVDARCRPDTDALPARLGLFTVSTANHETGHVQDVEFLSDQAHHRGGLFHTDACQAFTRVPFRPFDQGVDLVTVCAHKLGGPVGVGALAARDPSVLLPLLRGGGQEAGLRAGTEAAVLASAFSAAACSAHDAMTADAVRLRGLVLQLRNSITDVEPTAVFHSDDVDGLPNTLAVSFPGRRGPALVHRLDLEGCSVSHGSACASGSLRPSPVLLCMGAGDDAARSVVRVSMGHDTASEDVDRFVSALRVTLSASGPKAR
jgi:cysteine desulfurase